MSSPKSNGLSPSGKGTKKKVFRMGGGGVSVDGTKKEKKKADQKSPSRLTRSIPQAERKSQISEYLKRKKKSLVTQNIDKKMNDIVEAGVNELKAKKSEEAGQMLKQVYILEQREKLSKFKVDKKTARKEVNAKVKGKWVYDTPLARYAPGESAGNRTSKTKGGPKDFKDIPDRFPETLFHRT